MRITLNDSWLSGFTDAEGCFNTTVLANTRYTLGYVIKMQFVLDQNDENILKTIQDIFGFGIV